MGNNQTFIKDSIITLIRQVTSIVIGFLLIIILANGLGSEGLGQYTLITTFALMVTMFMNLGINTSTVYFVSKREIQLDQAFINNLIIGSILSILSIVAGYLFITLFGDQVFSEIPAKYLYFILLTLPFILLNSFFQTIFQGIQNFKVFNTILVITQFTNLTLVIILVLMAKIQVFGALIAFSVGHATTLFFILFIFFVKYKINLKGNIKLDVSYLKRSFFYGFKSYLSNLITYYNYRIPLFLIGFFINPAAVGLYSVAVNIAEKLSVFTQSISTVLLPKIASLGNEQERNNLTTIVSRFTLTFMILIVIILLPLSDLLVYVVGSEFAKSTTFFKVLLPGIALLAVEKILSNDIAARGKPEINMYVSIFNIIFNILLNIFLIPIYGVLGAAITTSVTYIISFFIKSILFSKITGESFITFTLLTKKDIYLLLNFLKKTAKMKSG